MTTIAKTTCTKDDWLSAKFNREVFKVDMPDGSLGADQSLGSHIHDHPGAIYSCVLPTRSIAQTLSLIRYGFYVVDVRVTLTCHRALPLPSERYGGIHVRECSPADQEDLLAIAGTAFEWSRFHLDPNIDNTIANRIKQEWVLSYINHKRGDSLWVAETRDRIVGFLASMRAEHVDEWGGIVDLIGVSQDHQHEGVGKCLIRRFFQRYGGCSFFQVGTQAANVGSIRFYESLGFRVSSTAYVLHLHTPPMP